MVARPHLVDVRRLFSRLQHSAPTGIDRVDFAYARRFLSAPFNGGAILTTSLGARLMPRPRAMELVSTLETRWRDEDPSAGDPDLAQVRRWLAGPPGTPSPTAPVNMIAVPLRHAILAEARHRAGIIRWRQAQKAPHGAIYLHTSHSRLDIAPQFAWLASRPDIRPIFFVHDLLPIEFPEYFAPGDPERHSRRMATVANCAATVMVGSTDVADRLSAHFRRERLRSPPIRVAPIGVEAAFAAPPAGSPRAGPGDRPYLIVCSTIEARKNHVLLLQIWRELAASMGDETPALVIVGRRGWESESAIDILDRCPAIRPHVIETSGLSTAGLASLISGARALLMPSFAEGYGIPVVEALALGTPVIASDIGVFREIAGDRATFLHPIDGVGWRDAIMRAALGPARGERGAGRYEVPTWDQHFGILDEVIAEL